MMRHIPAHWSDKIHNNSLGSNVTLGRLLDTVLSEIELPESVVHMDAGVLTLVTGITSSSF